MSFFSSKSSRSKIPGNSKWKLYLLAGQSNMEGMGWVRDLPSRLLEKQKSVRIYHPNRRKDFEPPDKLGHWQILGPGHGFGHRLEPRARIPGIPTISGRNGKEQARLSNRFGIELTFAEHLRQYDPDRKIALFKYAKGGSALHSDHPVDWGTWDADPKTRLKSNQWTHFRFHYKRALSNTRGLDGEADLLRPSGILWLQGESDASYTREIAEAYSENLHRLINSLRELTEEPKLPVIIGRLSTPQQSPSMPWAHLVQQAQEEFVRDDIHASLVHPEPGWQDEWHYDSDTYMQLGRQFADAMVHLEKGALGN